MSKLPATYYHVRKSKARIQIHQGGTRSGKTYSILTALIELCHKNTGLVITICRKTFPALRATAMRDFFEILNKEGAYNVELHNKSEGTYQLWGNLVEFISVDQPQKVRGRKREILFINEANELSLEDWRQLMLRTTDRVIIDFNPSDEFHWIYEQVIPREDADFFQTTYKDNPFLPESVVMEIERFKDVDENFWRVYGLGERGTSQATIFTHWKEIDQIPNEYKLLTTGSTLATQTTRPQLSESTPTDTDSRLMRYVMQRDLLIQISRKCFEITESIDRMLLSVTLLNQRASTRYTLTDSILTEQGKDATRLEAESHSYTLARLRSLLGVSTSYESYETTSGKKTRTESN
jgi:hypothetical protein